jgi:polyhydroxyalkanoate synthesis regulator phasin
MCLKFRKWRVGAVLLVVVLLAGAVSGMAFANSGQTDKGGLDTLYQGFVSKLAANLGVNQDQLTEAMDTTKKQMLDEAVQQGKLTQEQADRMASKKGFGFPGICFDGRGGQDFKVPGRNTDGVAGALGISVDQLKSELQSGKKMQDIVGEHGLTMEQFRQKMLELRKETIANAVSAGKLTQDQADKMLQKMEQRHNRDLATGEEDN